MGTAQVQGELWGAKACDWADLQEPQWQAVFELALAHAGVGPGVKLLDVGCGAGGALVRARALGSDVAGIDASENLAAIARARLPGARIECGEMEELPFDDEGFDIVTGINSFQFAGNVVRALAEARRVVRPGGTVFALSWGRPEDCQFVTVTMRAVLALLPPPPPGGNAPGPLADVLSPTTIREAGLSPLDCGEFSAELVFPDSATAMRAILSAGVTVRASRLLGDDRVAQAVRDTLPPVTRPDGSVAWTNRFRWLTGRR